MNTDILDLLTAIASMATSIEAIVVLVAVWFAIDQLREAVRARSLDAFLALSGDLKKETKARRFIYTELAELPEMTDNQMKEYLVQMTDDQKRKIERVCVTFDRMGVLVMHRLIPIDVAFSMYFDVVLRIWHLVEPFIREERRRRKSDIWMMYFEKLNAQCEEHWRELLKKRKDEWKYMKEYDDIFRCF